jgi:hypothetical protein
MTEYTDVLGDRWKVLTRPRKVLDANGEEFVWTVEVEQILPPAPADDCATRATNLVLWALCDAGFHIASLGDVEATRLHNRLADIIREHAPKVEALVELARRVRSRPCNCEKLPSEKCLCCEAADALCDLEGQP